MASLNKWLGIGNLTRDPETRYLANGDAVTSVSIACNESWKGKDGQKQERVEFVNLVFFRKLAEIVGKYCVKGSSVYVEGKLQTDKYTDKQGVERYTTKVIVDQMQMLGSKPAEQEKQFTGGAAKSAPKGDFSDFESDIPFIFNDLYSDSTTISKAFLRARRAR